MKASKETARTAREDLRAAVRMLDDMVVNDADRRRVFSALQRLETFLNVAEARLPANASYERARIRRRS